MATATATGPTAARPTSALLWPTAGLAPTIATPTLFTPLGSLAHPARAPSPALATQVGGQPGRASRCNCYTDSVWHPSARLQGCAAVRGLRLHSHLHQSYLPACYAAHRLGRLQWRNGRRLRDQAQCGRQLWRMWHDVHWWPDLPGDCCREWLVRLRVSTTSRLLPWWAHCYMRRWYSPSLAFRPALDHEFSLLRAA